MLLLKRIKMKYQYMTGRRHEHKIQRLHSKVITTYHRRNVICISSVCYVIYLIIN